MSELKSPGLFEIKQFIRNKTLVVFNTINNQCLKGKILWFDNDVFHLDLEDGREITILKSAVISYEVAHS